MKIRYLSIIFLLLTVVILSGCIMEKDKNNKTAPTHPPNKYGFSYDTLILAGKDDLGREVGLTKDGIPAYNQDKLVGIFYFVWHGASSTVGPYDNSKVINNDPNAMKSDSAWIKAGGGKVGDVHWWGEPLFGYFRATDRWVVERDVQMLTDAGIDFLIIDYSNRTAYQREVLLLLEVLDKYHNQGFNVPKVAFVTKAISGEKMMNLFNELYKPHSEYDHLWFRLEGKPMIIGNPNAIELTNEFKEYFTIRYAQWPREEVKRDDGFPWMSFERPQHIYGVELGQTMVNVSVAQHVGSLAFSTSAFYGDDSNRTRSFHNGANDKSPDSYLYGYNFQEQFEYAIEKDVDRVFITGWNEWIAGRQAEWHDVTVPVILVDNADINNSRDIQPMKDGYGDNYYMQMVSLIRKFKGARNPNSMVSNDTISSGKSIYMEGDFSQWDAAGVTYIDYANDISDRDSRGYGRLVYKNDTGRNDFYVMKVTHDQEFIYFYAQTLHDITNRTDSKWMNLFIKTGNNQDTWNGYDFVLNRISPTPEKAILEKTTGGWNWTTVEEVSYRVEKNEMHVAIPLSVLGFSSDSISLEFKWADNYQGEGDIWSFYIDGDAAPYGRLNYVYCNR